MVRETIKKLVKRKYEYVFDVKLLNYNKEQRYLFSLGEEVHFLFEENYKKIINVNLIFGNFNVNSNKCQLITNKEKKYIIKKFKKLFKIKKEEFFLKYKEDFYKERSEIYANKQTN